MDIYFPLFHGLAVWVSAPACVFSEEDAQKTLGWSFGRAACPLLMESLPSLALGVWCNAQVLDLLVRAGLDLVRRRRGTVRCQTTEPSPSKHQNYTSQFGGVFQGQWIGWPWPFP